MLQRLTDLELQNYISGLRKELAAVDQHITDITRRREQFANELVALHLPKLSNKTLLGIQKNFPYFLTVDMLNLFMTNRPMLGIFKPEGYNQALVILQAKFKAHVQIAGLAGKDDAMLREQSVSKNAWNGKLIAAERERQRRELDVKPTVNSRAEQKRPPDNSTGLSQPQSPSWPRKNRLVSGYDDDDTFMAANIGVQQSSDITQMMILQAVATESRQDCAMPDTSRIATDDSLGCFS